MKALANVESELDIEKLRNTARLITDSIRNYNKDYKNAHCKTPSVYREGDYVFRILDPRFTNETRRELETKITIQGTVLYKKYLGNNRYVITDMPNFNIGSRPLDTILSSDKING